MELTSGERIKLRRKELKISQTELAQKVGYSSLPYVRSKRIKAP